MEEGKKWEGRKGGRKLVNGAEATEDVVTETLETVSLE